MKIKFNKKHVIKKLEQSLRDNPLNGYLINGIFNPDIEKEMSPGYVTIHGEKFPMVAVVEKDSEQIHFFSFMKLISKSK